MKDVMIDLETFGTTHNAVVVQAGACYFDRVTGEIGETFLENINADTSLQHGFEVTGSTIYWWLEQNKEAQNSIMNGFRENVEVTITNLNDFLKGAKCVWSHATFDFVILMNHFNRLNIIPLIHYTAARDIRTLVDLAKIDHKNYERIGTYHNALDDCLYQVKYVTDCLNAMKGRIEWMHT